MRKKLKKLEELEGKLKKLEKFIGIVDTEKEREKKTINSIYQLDHLLSYAYPSFYCKPQKTFIERVEALEEAEERFDLLLEHLKVEYVDEKILKPKFTKKSKGRKVNK